MQKVIVLAAAIALASCGGADTSDAPASTDQAAEATASPADAGFEAVAPGTYEIVHTDGKIDQLTVHPGLTWSMVDADDRASGGTIFAQDGKVCFVTEGVDGHRCFLGTPPAADGSIEVTGDDGAKATVRPVSIAAETPEV